jgi:hypothetical protein
MNGPTCIIWANLTPFSPQSALQIVASQNVTLMLKTPAREQYVLRVHAGSASPGR